MGNTPFREAYIEAGDAAHIAKVADAVKDRINVPLPDEPEKFPHSSGCTPLTFALGEPHPSLEKIQALLRVGARVDQADINNNYPLAVCCRNAAASGAILSALLEHIPAPQRNCIHQREGDGHSPLQVLSASLVKRAPADAAACVRVLVQHGANLAETDSAGNSVLHIANGHENHNGSVPIFRAFAGLLEGPTVSVALRPNNADVTPLHLAAGRGCPADVQMLLVLGADPDAVDVKGDTVLHYLAASNCTEEDVEACCAALRAANANPSVHNKKHGETPLTLAGTQGQITFIAPFFKHFHTVPGFDVNAKNNNGDAALHTFFDHGSFPLLKLIKECGADPNAQGHDGNTVLHLCALREQHFTMKALLAEVGSFDVELENAKGKTVLALCAAGKYKCHSHMQLLLMGYDRA